LKSPAPQGQKPMRLRAEGGHKKHALCSFLEGSGVQQIRFKPKDAQPLGRQHKRAQ
jgi:hypothetical protein